MGVQELGQFLRTWKKRDNTLAELRGSKIGVDVSMYLHKAVGLKEGADQFHSIPSIPVAMVTTVLRNLVDTLAAFDITAVFVFDGCPHPLKAAENEKRKADRDAAQLKLDGLLALGRPQDLNEIDKLRRKAVFVREDVVQVALLFLKGAARCEVVGAPFEADWQLVELERSGYTRATLAEDTDLFVLGSLVLVQQLVCDKKGACSIVRRGDRLATEALGGSKWSTTDLAVYSALVGCDFIDRLQGNSQKKVRALMDRWTTGAEGSTERAEAQEAVLASLELLKWPKQGQGGGQVCGTAYRKHFWQAVAIFLHAPVTRRTVSATGVVVLSLEPLYPLPRTDALSTPPRPGTRRHATEWQVLIGFSPAGLFDIRGASLSDAFVMDKWCRTGTALRPLTRPLDSTTSLAVPHGAVQLRCRWCTNLLTRSFHGLGIGTFHWCARRSGPTWKRSYPPPWPAPPRCPSSRARTGKRRRVTRTT